MIIPIFFQTAESRRRAFTLIEIMMVMVIVVSLTNIAFLGILRSRREAQSAVCAENRRIIQDAEIMYFTNLNQHSVNFQDLVNAGYLAEVPSCPAGGVYAWQDYPSSDARYKTELGCSLHTASQAQVTPPAEETPPVEVTPAKKEKKGKKQK